MPAISELISPTDVQNLHAAAWKAEQDEPSVDSNEENMLPFEAQFTPDASSAPALEEVSIINRGELSPTGSLVLVAAHRINNLLEKRAVNNAHSEALKEYRTLDESGYIDHLGTLSSSTEATPMARVSAEMSLALEQRKADREMLVDKAKTKVRGFGRAALSRLKNVGTITTEIAVGIGVTAGQAGINGAKRGYESTKEGANKTADMAGEGIMTGFKKLENGLDRGSEAISSKLKSAKEIVADMNKVRVQKAAARDEIARTEEYKVHAEKMAYKRERLEKKQAAQERRSERRARWSANYNVAKNTAISGVESVKAGYDASADKASELRERAKLKTEVYRSAGRAALETYKTTKADLENK